MKKSAPKKPPKKKKSERYEEALVEIADYVGDESEWLVIKKQLLRVLSSDLRVGFSTRDPITKKHGPLNRFEKRLVTAWERITGRPVIFTPDESTIERQ